MIGEVAVSGGFLLMKIFSSRISSDTNHLGRALSVPAASGGVLILVGDSVYWRLRAVELGDDDDVFHLARILKQSKQYEEETSIARAAEEQLDVKKDVKLDMELDMTISHGRAREEREACARGEEEVQDGPTPGQTDRHAGPMPGGGITDSPASAAGAGRVLATIRARSHRSLHGLNRQPVRARSAGLDGRVQVCLDRIYCSDEKIVNQENKDSADIINWREYQALRNEMRRESRTQNDALRGTVQGISQKLDTTCETVTTMKDQMTDIQRSLADLRLAVENLTAQQQQEDDEDPELQNDAHNARGAPSGNRPRGFAELRRPGRGFEEEDGLGKPKFSIPKFEGGADVEEYLSNIEKLWNLRPNYSEDRKIKLGSSEFDGYALRWWDAFVRNRDEDGEQPIRTWRAMKEAMTSRFVPTNYLWNIFDKLTLLRQGVKTVDEYYMEMEILMQRGRVRVMSQV
ncbi:hypothetical protein QYE76_060991 [Lolium multiflorum]|uniref:Retrotransposon gag domain-containing protein n=1 Tax=Lolium multiflorum TaxID=4521 RepID=A0AAD8W4A8_LOLMU|nr:hypothetical protein QYE76_060991 [Lolium multiflorum]